MSFVFGLPRNYHKPISPAIDSLYNEESSHVVSIRNQTAMGGKSGRRQQEENGSMEAW